MPEISHMKKIIWRKTKRKESGKESHVKANESCVKKNKKIKINESCKSRIEINGLCVGGNHMQEKNLNNYLFF